MIPLISPSNMLACERRYFFESGVKSITVMEHAAQALADVIRAELPAGSSIHLACGTGGNGGDGTACARLLHRDYCCTIIQLKEPKSPDAIENLRRARECGIPVLTATLASHTAAPDAWVDALFGTGLTGEPGGEYADVIRLINRHRDNGAKVFSADIPSGLNGATGKAFSSCVRADHTVTFQHIKTGLVLADGLDVCGKLTVADALFPPTAFSVSDMDAFVTESSDIKHLLPSRFRNIHKGNCGHLLIIAGSFGMAGAAAMCAKAALRSGVGLLTIACVKSIVPILQTLVPQAMCVPLDENDGAISIDALPKLKDMLKGKDAVVVGPGLTRRVPPQILHAVLESGITSVIDADALNILSEHRELLPLLNKNHVITPHPGEALRLIPDLDTSEPLAAAKLLTGICPNVLYKGASCVIAGDEMVLVSKSGGCGMARGGSGDILCGVMGALLAEKSKNNIAFTIALAKEIHGLAGELAQEKYGKRGMNAMDITEFLPEVLHE